MSKKVDRVAHDPSWTEVILGAALSLALGVALGAVVLVVKPMTRVKAEVKEEERVKGMLYFVEGARDANKVKQALAKRKSIGPGQTITITEAELNAIVAPAMPVAAKPGEKAGAAATGETVNFRIHDGRMQVAMPLNLNVAGIGLNPLAVARGTIVKEGDRYIFRADEIFVGSLPLQRLPGAMAYAQANYLDKQELPEDIKAALAQAKEVTIEGDAIKVTL